MDKVRRHSAITDTIDMVGIDAGVPQIFLQAQPRCRHLADAGEPELCEISELEIGIGIATDDRERVAADDFGKADERRTGMVAMVLHNPHWAGPYHVDRTVDQRLLGFASAGRRQQIDLQPFGLISPDRMRRIKRRVQDKAVVLEKPQPHRRTIPSPQRPYFARFSPTNNALASDAPKVRFART